LLSGTLPNLVYQAASNFFGSDSFTFRVEDGLANSDSALVSIVVRPVNDAPVAQSQSVSLDEDTTSAITLVARDIEGDVLTYMVAQPSHGTLTGVAPNLTYHPLTNYFGADSFSFKANDGQTDSAPAVVSITVRPVNDAPLARIKVSPVAEFPGLSNQVVIASACSTNADVVLDGSGSSDVENDPLSYTWMDGTNLAATGVLATNELGVGVHEITLSVSDGKDTGTAVIKLEVKTPAEAVGIIIDEVNQSALESRQQAPLIATLRAAAASLKRCNLIAAANQLHAFENKVRAQVAPVGQSLAGDLEKAAQIIIDVIADQ
jgi:hypothetical protein